MVKKSEIVKCIRLAYSSLDSHLDWAWKEKGEKRRKKLGSFGGVDFHKKAIKEYQYIINTLIKLL